MSQVLNLSASRPDLAGPNSCIDERIRGLRADALSLRNGIVDQPSQSRPQQTTRAAAVIREIAAWMLEVGSATDDPNPLILVQGWTLADGLPDIEQDLRKLNEDTQSDGDELRAEALWNLDRFADRWQRFQAGNTARQVDASRSVRGLLRPLMSALAVVADDAGVWQNRWKAQSEALRAWLERSRAAMGAHRFFQAVDDLAQELDGAMERACANAVSRPDLPYLEELSAYAHWAAMLMHTAGLAGGEGVVSERWLDRLTDRLLTVVDTLSRTLGAGIGEISQGTWDVDCAWELNQLERLVGLASVVQQWQHMTQTAHADISRAIENSARWLAAVNANGGDHDRAVDSARAALLSDAVAPCLEVLSQDRSQLSTQQIRRAGTLATKELGTSMARCVALMLKLDRPASARTDPACASWYTRLTALRDRMTFLNRVESIIDRIREVDRSAIRECMSVIRVVCESLEHPVRAISADALLRQIVTSFDRIDRCVARTSDNAAAPIPERQRWQAVIERDQVALIKMMAGLAVSLGEARWESQETRDFDDVVAGIEALERAVNLAVLSAQVDAGEVDLDHLNQWSGWQQRPDWYTANVSDLKRDVPSLPGEYESSLPTGRLRTEIIEGRYESLRFACRLAELLKDVLPDRALSGGAGVISQVVYPLTARIENDLPLPWSCRAIASVCVYQREAMDATESGRPSGYRRAAVLYADDLVSRLLAGAP